MRKRLRKLGARRISAGDESNELYDDRNGTLLKTGRILRLRCCAAKGLLTFKGPREPGRHKKRREIETSVDFRAMKAILKDLGYRIVQTYQKYREEYEVGDAHVTIDRLSGAGWFVEIEAPSRVISRIERQLELGPGDREERSYLELKLAVQKNSRKLP